MLLRKLRSVLSVLKGAGSGLPRADIVKHQARGSCRI